MKCSRRHWKTGDNMMPMMARKGFASKCSNGSDAVVHCCHRLDSMVGRACGFIDEAMEFFAFSRIICYEFRRCRKFRRGAASR